MHHANHPSTRMALASAMALAVAGALLALVALASAPAEAAGKFKTVTKTFNQPAPIDIPGGIGGTGNGLPYPSTRNVSGFPKGAKIVDVNLVLRGFTHQAPAEVDFMLAHQGVNRTVLSDAGGILDVEGVTLTLDDQAQAAPPQNGQIVSGRFRPANFEGNNDDFEDPAPVASGLAGLNGGFKGKNPEGAWQLFVYDQFNAGEGALSQGYSLKIKAKFRR